MLDQKDFRKMHPRFSGDNLGRNLRLVEKVETMARRKKVTTAQLALAWVLSRGEDIIPIPGTRHERYLRDNIAATEISLAAEEISALEAAMPRGVAAGDRYSAEGMKRIGL